MSSFSQVYGRVEFGLASANGQECNAYERSLRGEPIVGAKIAGQVGSGFNGVDYEITNSAGEYTVAPGCPNGDEDLVDVYVFEPRGGIPLNPMPLIKCSSSGEYNILLQHPEEPYFSINGAELSNVNPPRYTVNFCDGDPHELKLNLLGKWNQFGTMYKVNVWNDLSQLIYTQEESGLEGLNNPSGLNSSINLEGLLDYFYSHSQDLSEYYYVQLQVGNCNGWKPMKYGAGLFLNDYSGLTLEKVKFSPSGQGGEDVSNTTCSSPIGGSLFGGGVDFSDVVGTANQIYMRISQYNKNDCSATNKVLNGVTITLGSLDQSYPVGVMAYFVKSLDPTPAPNSPYSPGNPNNSSTGDNFYLNSFLSGDFMNYTYKIEIVASNSCKSVLKTFWFNPTEAKLSNALSKESIQLVSNPVVDQLEFLYQTDETHQFSLDIYNEMGQSIFSNGSQMASKGQGRLTYDISNFKQGIYFYRLTSDGNLIKTGKFVK